ncbi:hypothetical protein G5T42_07810 [Microbacterium sp. 4R-513]|uniref:hypothetical protein n=1 Tax=Microbacterium sp. 4R-513 TaxID=2567934 RepID=UPI0013E110FE|nr:hypothetical protein [Microbacterium sp. 4R-513]QIG39399.1 hypothetical protein G5T42_07810 [Microbacterium sp. 4R-513]
MTNVADVIAQSGTPSGATVDFSSYIIVFASVAIAAIVGKAIFARRAKASVASTVPGATAGAAIRIAPAPPFPADVARLRALLGQPTPAPRITRYTIPVVTVDNRSLIIRDKKIGEILVIPLEDIASIEARDASLRPKGTFLSRTYPSLWVTVRRGTTELTVPLTPLVGAYDKARPSDVAAMAAELNAHLQPSIH